ncbi:MAG: class I SAM-dependent methyltransferase [Marinifilaceae bacterium]|jgi:2-polyprenyl-3-methyl-5-hydroxy-6-metoxy-1,4-benzoquinol methylase|nr:class I SAM-dependent methyltransferase [Marinifilaceae bacterium]
MEDYEINIRNKHIWNSNSDEWNNYMGEDGNSWHKILIAPETERLLDLKKGNKLLDIGCGNGIFARKMAKKGINVTAFDFSNKNINNALKYNTNNIEYLILDATLNNDLEKLNSKTYDGIAANMVFMDIPKIDCIFSKIYKLLTKNGNFVFSIQHPCFNSEYVNIKNDNSLHITNYIDTNTSKGNAIPTQKVEQYYFHRSISYYVNLGISNNLVINGFNEPVFKSNGKKEIYSKFPPVLIISMKRNI